MAGQEGATMAGHGVAAASATGEAPSNSNPSTYASLNRAWAAKTTGLPGGAGAGGAALPNNEAIDDTMEDPDSSPASAPPPAELAHPAAEPPTQLPVVARLESSRFVSLAGVGSSQKSTSNAPRIEHHVLRSRHSASDMFPL